MTRAVEYSIIVPVYNSQDSLTPLFERLIRIFDELGKQLEIIFVDDCSRDRSWEVLTDLAHGDRRVQAIQLMRNYGQSAATMCGLRYASGEYLITIDDDLQNPPEEIPKLIETLNSRPELDVVIGVPEKKRHSFLRRQGSKFVNWVSSRQIFRQNPELKLTSFRIIRRGVADYLLSMDIPRPAPGAILCTITSRIANVTVRHEPRPYGKGGYTVGKILGLTLDKTLNFSTFPLRLLALLGLIGILFSTGVGTVFFIRYLLGGIKVAGWITLVILLTTVAGFNFFAFGIIGEYLLRILHGVHRTPQFLVRQRVSESPGAAPGDET